RRWRPLDEARSAVDGPGRCGGRRTAVPLRGASPDRSEPAWALQVELLLEVARLELAGGFGVEPDEPRLGDRADARDHVADLPAQSPDVVDWPRLLAGRRVRERQLEEERRLAFRIRFMANLRAQDLRRARLEPLKLAFELRVDGLHGLIVRLETLRSCKLSTWRTSVSMSCNLCAVYVASERCPSRHRSSRRRAWRSFASSSSRSSSAISWGRRAETRRCSHARSSPATATCSASLRRGARVGRRERGGRRRGAGGCGAVALSVLARVELPGRRRLLGAPGQRLVG